MGEPWVPRVIRRPPPPRACARAAVPSTRSGTRPGGARRSRSPAPGPAPSRRPARAGSGGGSGSPAARRSGWAGRRPRRPTPTPVPARAAAPPAAAPACRGGAAFEKSSSVPAVSTIRPRYMTATRSHTCRTTAMLWAMKSIVRPSSLRSSSSRLRTVACTETSSAETGSSATRSSGWRARARAIETRWRWPPEKLRGCESRALAGSPTRSSSSRQRASIPLRGTILCTRRSSESVWRTVMRGLSEEYGSWKTIWIRRRSERARLAARVSPA